MIRAKPLLLRLVWLLALLALVAPPGFAAHATMMPEKAMADCAHHAPPPCPDDGTAKHAASTCCPAMAGAVALLSAAPVALTPPAATPVERPVPGLAGRTVSKDPPPPRA